MASDELTVVPIALRAASRIVAEHAAQVTLSSDSSAASVELSGIAASAVHGASSGYCAEFSRRLSSVSAALVDAAGSFTAMETSHSEQLATVCPRQQV